MDASRQPLWLAFICGSVVFVSCLMCGGCVSLVASNAMVAGMPAEEVNEAIARDGAQLMWVGFGILVSTVPAAVLGILVGVATRFDA